MCCCESARPLWVGNLQKTDEIFHLSLRHLCGLLSHLFFWNPDLSFASRFVPNLFFTDILGPNQGAEKTPQLLVRIQLTTPERESEMPELLLADDTEAQSNLLSSFRTKKKDPNNSCADDIILGNQTL